MHIAMRIPQKTSLTAHGWSGISTPTFHIDEKTYIDTIRPPPRAPLLGLVLAATNAPAAANAAATAPAVASHALFGTQ